MTTFKVKALPVIFGSLMMIHGWMSPQTAQGQQWPVSFEGASALKPAQLEISLYGAGSYYTISYGGESVSGTIGYLPGLKVGIGIVNNFDVKASYSRGFYKRATKLEDSKSNNISIMPKVSFLQGHLAFQLPFTVMLANVSYNGEERSETYYLLSPRLIGSYRYKQYIEVNLSPLFEVFIPGQGDDPSYFIGGNLGLALSSNLQRWSVRPEGFISYLFPQDDVDYSFLYYGWGLAFTYNIDFKK